MTSTRDIPYLLWWHKPLGAQTPVRVFLKRRLTRAEKGGKDSDLEWTYDRVDEGTLRNFYYSLMGTIWALFHPIRVGILAWLIRLPLLPLTPITVFVVNAFTRTISHLPARPLQPLFSTVVILSAIFGTVHCAGWNFPFYTYTEQTLWRAASLAVTSTTCTIAISILGFPANTRFVLFTITPVYATAKLVLLGLAVAQLRGLPPSSFIAIDWVKYYPHI